MANVLATLSPIFASVQPLVAITCVFALCVVFCACELGFLFSVLYFLVFINIFTQSKLQLSLAHKHELCCNIFLQFNVLYSVIFLKYCVRNVVFWASVLCIFVCTVFCLCNVFCTYLWRIRSVYRVFAGFVYIVFSLVCCVLYLHVY